jgi:hypothetical protein
MTVMTTVDAELRSQIVTLLDGGAAHARAKEILRGFPRSRIGERLPGFAHSAWELLEHLRIGQNDILRFCLEPRYRSPAWPKDYWPKQPAPSNKQAWTRSARSFLADLRACVRVARDRRIDLLAPLPHSPDATWLYELCLVADHNTYHLGQLMLVRRALESAPESGEPRKPRKVTRKRRT